MISVNEFKELLEKNSSVNAYEIKDRVNESFQLFYVMRNLETNRSVNVEELRAEIYVDFDEFRGSSSVTVTSADDLETVAKKIDDAIEKAKKAKNPYYPLVCKTENLTKISEKKQNLALNAKIAADAIFAGEGQENSQLNATEVFADHDRIHFLNSNGVEHVYDEYAMFYETIPSYNGEKEDVELYFNQYNGAPDQEKYSSDIRTALANVKHRYNAVKPSNVCIPEDTLIAVQKDMLNDVLTNFASELNYSRQYYKMSHFSLGDRISEVPFDMVLKGEEEGVSNSSPVDGNGIILKETKVIDQGVACDGKNPRADGRFGLIVIGELALYFFKNVRAQILRVRVIADAGGNIAHYLAVVGGINLLQIHDSHPFFFSVLSFFLSGRWGTPAAKTMSISSIFSSLLS